MESFTDICKMLCRRNSTEDWIFYYPEMEGREDETDLSHLKKFIDRSLDNACELQNMMDKYVSDVLIKGSHYALEWKSDIREVLDYFLDQRCSFNTDVLLTLSDQEMMVDNLSEIGVVAYIVKHYNIESLGLETVNTVSEREYENFRVTKENILITLKSILAENEQWLQ